MVFDVILYNYLNINLNLKVMKNLLYILAILLIVIWGIVFKPAENIHLLIGLAVVIIIINLFFDKRLSKQ